ncbi:MAG TPA: alpha/beta hydrolase [Pseudonocardiaceae bacterium]
MHRVLTSLVLSLITCGVIVTLLPDRAAAEPAPVTQQSSSARQGEYTEEDVTFSSGEITLNGTVMVPAGEGPFPAVALVHGAGKGLRDRNAGVAEAFARSGVLTLVYDKRTQGYTAEGIGQRDYGLLADDALAAVRMLRERPDVEADQVGLWGLSEGAWVAPLAASRSEDVAYLVLAGASAVPPAQQESWRHEAQLRELGVSGSLLRAIPHKLMQLVAAARMMPEADYDPVPVLEKVRQPVLAVWGAEERTGPPAESSELLAASLDKAGNRAYTVRFLEGGNHELKDDADPAKGYLPEYLDLITAWVGEVTSGNPPATSMDPAPAQEFRSWAGVVRPPAILSGGWLQLGVFLLMAVAFPLFLFVNMSSLRAAPTAMSAPAYTLAVTGWIAAVGMFVYIMGYLFGGPSSVGPIVAGRPVIWLLVQLLAVVAVIAALVLLVAWVRSRPDLALSETVRYVIVLGGAVIFVPWAYYWGLLRP